MVSGWNVLKVHQSRGTKIVPLQDVPVLGVACDGFHPKFRWICRREQEEKLWNSLKHWNSVVDGRNKPARQCFFQFPKNVTSERPIALLPVVIFGGSGAVAGARSGEMAAEASCWVGRY